MAARRGDRCDPRPPRDRSGDGDRPRAPTVGPSASRRARSCGRRAPSTASRRWPRWRVPSRRSPCSTRAALRSPTRLVQSPSSNRQGPRRPCRSPARSSRWQAAGTGSSPVATTGRSTSSIRTGTPREVAQSEKHGIEVNTLEVSPDGKTLVSGGDDRQIITWTIGSDGSLTAPLFHGRPHGSGQHAVPQPGRPLARFVRRGRARHPLEPGHGRTCRRPDPCRPGAGARLRDRGPAALHLRRSRGRATLGHATRGVGQGRL